MTEEPKTVDGARILGIVPGKPAVGEEKVPHGLVFTWPHLVVRHAVVALGSLLTVLVISLWFDAPLREIANPTVTPNPEKAPWYFVGLQELLAHLHPMVAGVLVPGMVLVGLVALPYIDRNPRRESRRRKVAVWTFTVFLAAWIVVTVIGFAFRGPDWSWVWPWQEWYGEL